LQGVWFKDRLLKVKSLEDRQQEDFGHRTISIKNLPQIYEQQDVWNICKKYGEIVSVEMPFERIDSTS